MRLWRISDFADLSGEGGLHASGRWHTRGRQVVHLADHPASALVEVLVHLEIDVEDVPTHYQLLELDIPDDIPIANLTGQDLARDWTRQLAITRAHGDAWLAGRTTALLQVPSAIVPAASNYLLNPLHHDAGRIGIASLARAAFDDRLIRFARS